MKKGRISNNVIRRLPKYLRKLDDLIYHGVDRISSNELGKQMGLTPSQIRQDFSCFGEFGQQGYGYRVSELRDQVARILGMYQNYSVTIVGVGNLGQALIGNMGFSSLGFSITGAFDSNPDKIGTTIGNVSVMDSANLNTWLNENPTDIVVLTIPRRIAKKVACEVADCGIKGIWNFTNIDLELNREDVRVENIHFSDSLLSLSYYITAQENDNKKIEE